MAKIYEPKGAAREYSPLALNYFNGCDHQCVYCYVPKIKKLYKPDYDHKNVNAKQGTLKEIERSAKKFNNSPKQVLLSFLSDPYCEYNNKVKLTREVLKILYNNRIPVSILTKGGKNIFQDLDIIKKFGSNIKVGMTLTTTILKESQKWEPFSSTPDERLKTLKILKENNIITWASMEPVFDPIESLKIMDTWYPYIDQFKIGKMNHFPDFERKINWGWFLIHAVSVMRNHNKPFYIKKDLLEFKPPDLHLNDKEINMDYLCIKNNFGNQIKIY